MGDFFAFRKMVTLPLMRVLYVIGVVAITWVIYTATGDQVHMHTYFNMPTQGVWTMAALQFVAAQLVWRVACEGVVVVFSIYESLRRIERKE